MSADAMVTTSASYGLSVRWFSGRLRSALLRRFEDLQWGSLEVRETGRSPRRFGTQGASEPSVVLTVNDPATWAYVALGADIGAGQSYALGMWDTSDLRDTMRIFLRNESVLSGIESGWSRLSMPLYRWVHRNRDNSQAGSRRNIAAHYDLGNDFFGTFLDEQLLYSAAVFPTPETSLEDAQVEKMDRICRNLDLQAGQRVLEIGSGWGGFALHAASRYGVHVRTITLSQEQFAHTRQLVAQHGLSDRVEVQLVDYRDLEGQGVYDHVVSIEMIEAVGHRHMATYLSTIDRLLRPGGGVMIQGITFPDRGFERYLKMSDFIRHFIFPGGSLVSLRQVLDAAAVATRLEMQHLEDIGQDYALTLREWAARFQATRGTLPEPYQDAAFQRLWLFYLQSCEACFLERRTSAVQIGFRKAMQ